MQQQLDAEVQNGCPENYLLKIGSKLWLKIGANFFFSRFESEILRHGSHVALEEQILKGWVWFQQERFAEYMKDVIQWRFCQ